MPREKVEWVAGYAEADAVLRHRQMHELTFKSMAALLGDVIVTLHGADHRARRVVEGRLFAAALLRDDERDIIPAIVAEELAGQTGAGDLVALVQAMAGRIAARLIGLDPLDDADGVAEALTYLNALVGGASAARRGDTPVRREQAPTRFRERFIAPALDRRRRLVADYQAGTLAENALPRDLLTLLLLHDVDERRIAGEATFYAVAAIETTANLVPHMLHHAWAWAAAHPEQAYLLTEPAFMQRVAAEALRLHPAIPTIFRRAAARIELNGRIFEPGRTVGVLVSQANRDPMIFGHDADLFEPLRVVPPKIRRAGLSFGGGAHLCLGREMALGDNFGHDTGQWGEAVLLALAIVRAGARPHPDHPMPALSPFARDVYHHYPIIFTPQS